MKNYSSSLCWISPSIITCRIDSIARRNFHKWVNNAGHVRYNCMRLSFHCIIPRNASLHTHCKQQTMVVCVLFTVFEGPTNPCFQNLTCSIDWHCTLYSVELLFIANTSVLFNLKPFSLTVHSLETAQGRTWHPQRSGLNPICIFIVVHFFTHQQWITLLQFSQRSSQCAVDNGSIDIAAVVLGADVVLDVNWMDLFDCSLLNNELDTTAI